MGVDFTALFALPTGAKPEALAALLESALPAGSVRWPAAFLEDYPNLQSEPHRWVVDRDPRYPSPEDEFTATGSVSLSGSEGFSATSGGSTLELAHVTRWRSYLEDTNHREVIDHACERVAAALRSPEWICLPDSGFEVSITSDLVYDGASLPRVSEFLAEKFGSPSTADELVQGGVESLEYGYLVRANRRT